MKLKRLLSATSLAIIAVATTLPAWAQSAPTSEDFLIDLGAVGLSQGLPDEGLPFMALGDAMGMPLPPPAFDGDEDGPPMPPQFVSDVPPGMGGAMMPPPPMLAAHDGKEGPPHCPPGGPGCGPRGGGPMSGLNLSDDQYEQMFALRKSSMGKMAPKMGELMAAQVDLRDQMLKPEIDKGKINSIQSRINALRAEIANQKLEDHIAMISVLTAEQRKQLRLGMIKHMACRGMGGPGGSGGGHHRGFGGRH